MSRRFLVLVITLSLPLLASAQHFGRAFIDLRLVPPDSVHVEVTADREDFFNTVQTFPDVFDGNPQAFAALYQQRLEAYLQTRVHVRAGGKAVRLAAIRWKPGGAGRADALDSADVWTPYHTITLGGRLPAGAVHMTVRADLWVERPDRPRITMVEYAYHEGKHTLRRVWEPTERVVRFPLAPDSLAALHKTTPPPATERVPVDHAGHKH